MKTSPRIHQHNEYGQRFLLQQLQGAQATRLTSRRREQHTCEAIICFCSAVIIGAIFTTSILVLVNNSVDFVNTELFAGNISTSAAVLVRNNGSNNAEEEHIYAGKNEHRNRQRYRYYIYPNPQMTTDLVRRDSKTGRVNPAAERYVNIVQRQRSEDVAEIWLHRGFEINEDRTTDPLQADAFFIPAHLYMSARAGGHRRRMQVFKSKLSKAIDNVESAFQNRRNKIVKHAIKNITDDKVVEHDSRPSHRPHVLLCPATSAPWAAQIGIDGLVKFLSEKVGRSNVYIISFERNAGWVGSTLLQNVIVAPYVITPDKRLSSLALMKELYTNNARRNDFVFYVADPRPNAMAWAGCDRSMVKPLIDEPNMKIGLGKGGAVSFREFQRYMSESDYCLVTCGDTPTSRRLTDAMVTGCIPIFIGTRLFGECESPCFRGWGWTYTRGLYHLPYEDEVDWASFPVVNESQFTASPKAALEDVFRNFTLARKKELRLMMQSFQLAFLYGLGSPISSNKFGSAVPHLWRSVQKILSSRNKGN